LPGARGPRGRAAEAVPGDDPGPATGLQRPHAHHPLRRPPGAVLPLRGERRAGPVPDAGAGAHHRFMSDDPGPWFGAYLHIPFCAKRCDYCAFATWTDRHHLEDRYLTALGIEVRRAVD